MLTIHFYLHSQDKTKKRDVGACIESTSTDYPDISGSFKLKYARKDDATKGKFLAKVFDGATGCKKKAECYIKVTDGTCSEPGDELLAYQYFSKKGQGKAKVSEKGEFGFTAETGDEEAYVVTVYSPVTKEDPTPYSIGCGTLELLEGNKKLKC